MSAAGLFDSPTPEVVMSTDLESLPAAVQPLSAEVTPMLLIQRAMESGIEPGKLYELAQQWERDQAAERFAAALAAFQAKCPQITKRRKIDLGGGNGPMYASLDDIMAKIQGLLAECGLAVTFSAGITDGGQLVAKCMIHHGRHIEASEITLPVPTQMRVNDTQKMGAALSYAKRYALCAALNIVVSDEDRDGNGLLETITEEQALILDEWITNTNSDKAKFLNVFDVKSLDELPASRFDDALKALKNKQRAMRR